MGRFVFFWCAALILGLGADPTYPQQQDQNPQGRSGFSVRVDPSNSWSLWDDTRNELIVSAGSSQQEADRIGPLVNIYNVVSGEKRSIDIQKDFPSARYINVDALDEERSSDESYPLLVKYSSKGKVVLQALPRSLFADVDDPSGDRLGEPRRGTTRVAVNKEAIHVYLAPTSEMIALSQAGQIRTRVNVTGKLSEFARLKGYKNFYVDGDEFSPSGDLWLVGHLKELVENNSASLPARNFVVRLTPEGQLEVPYQHVGDEPAGYYLPKLIGFTQSNEPVQLSDPTSGYLFVQKGPY